MQLGIILFAACVVILALDVHSSKRNNGSPFIHESTKIFRLPNGDCNIPKLILYKGGLLGIVTAAASALYAFGAGNFSFMVFIVMGFVTLPTAIKNYQLHAKFH